ncbi:MAG: hypothetical protein NT154_30355, partial [Verrucomicrobia bacterium]|nr:hypothetical protein [Verrucomicrobiota bacterium]
IADPLALARVSQADRARAAKAVAVVMGVLAVEPRLRKATTRNQPHSTRRANRPRNGTRA